MSTMRVPTMEEKRRLMENARGGGGGVKNTDDNWNNAEAYDLPTRAATMCISQPKYQNQNSPQQSNVYATPPPSETPNRFVSVNGKKLTSAEKSRLLEDAKRKSWSNSPTMEDKRRLVENAKVGTDGKFSASDRRTPNNNQTDDPYNLPSRATTVRTTRLLQPSTKPRNQRPMSYHEDPNYDPAPVQQRRKSQHHIPEKDNGYVVPVPQHLQHRRKSQPLAPEEDNNYVAPVPQHLQRRRNSPPQDGRKQNVTRMETEEPSWMKLSLDFQEAEQLVANMRSGGFVVRASARSGYTLVVNDNGDVLNLPISKIDGLHCFGGNSYPSLKLLVNDHGLQGGNHMQSNKTGLALILDILPWDLLL